MAITSVGVATIRTKGGAMALVNLKICRVNMARGAFIPVHCALCNHKRENCPNWQEWLEECPQFEVKNEGNEK